MLNTLTTIALLGGGMWISVIQIPAQWPQIITLGALAAFLVFWIGSLLPPSAPSVQARPTSLSGSREGGKTLFGLAFLIAAMGLATAWLVLREDSMAVLSVGMASTAVFLAGACLGLAAYLMILAWKPAR